MALAKLLVALCLLINVAGLLTPVKLPNLGRLTRIHSLYWLLAPLFVVFLVACQVISVSDIGVTFVGDDYIVPWKLLLIFASLSYLSLSWAASGTFRYAALLLLRRSRTGGRLFINLYLLACVMSLILGHEVAILASAGIILDFSRELKITGFPFLIATFFASNFCSIAFITSNPVTIVFAASNHLDFAGYFAWMFLPTVAGAATSLACFWFAFHKQLNFPITLPEELTMPGLTKNFETSESNEYSSERKIPISVMGFAPHSELEIFTASRDKSSSNSGSTHSIRKKNLPVQTFGQMGMANLVNEKESLSEDDLRRAYDEENPLQESMLKLSSAHFNQVHAIFAGVVFGAMIIALVAATWIGAQMWQIVTPAAALMLILNAAVDIMAPVQGMSFYRTRSAAMEMPWEKFLYMAAMFVVVDAMIVSGWVNILAEELALAERRPFTGLFFITISSAITSNLLNSEVAAVVYARLLHTDNFSEMVGAITQDLSSYGAIIGIAISVNVVITSSAIGLLWRSNVNSRGFKMPFFRFMKFGAFIAVPTMAASAFVVFIQEYATK